MMQDTHNQRDIKLSETLLHEVFGRYAKKPAKIAISLLGIVDVPGVVIAAGVVDALGHVFTVLAVPAADL